MSFPKLKHPIVLIHGLGSLGQYGPVDYFYKIPELIRNSGSRVFIANLPVWASVERRARALKLQLQREFPELLHEEEGFRLNLVGHSLGGLDSRYLVSNLGFGPSVASITSIGTPNRGTSIADLALGIIPKKAFDVSEQVLSLFNYASHDGLRFASRAYAKDYHHSMFKNVEGIAYFSATTVIRRPVWMYSLPVFWYTEKILRGFEGENDGFVSEESAKWGEHILTEYADHYAQIGHPLGNTHGFDHVDFMRKILHHLERHGF